MQYPCSRCGGSGSISAYSHVMAGVCFKCGGSGKQDRKPSVSVMWAILDTNGKHIYNFSGKTPNEAIKKAVKTFAGASESFRSEHDITKPVAVPYDEHWTQEKIDQLHTI